MMPNEPTDRFAEIAGILAAGVLRLRKRYLLAENTAETTPRTSSDSANEGLDYHAEKRLSVQCG